MNGCKVYIFKANLCAAEHRNKKENTMLDYTKKELLGILAQLEKISDGLGVLLDSEEERAETSGGEDAETVCDALDEALDGVNEAYSVLDELLDE